MHSLRAKITAMTIGAIIITMIIVAAFGMVSIQRLGMSDAERMLRLLCEVGEKNLDDVVRRADRAMYENKRSAKRQRLEGTEFEA